MKAKQLLVTLACLLSTASVWASAITYNVNRVIGAGSVSGTITTDGTFGTLATGNVTNWSLTIDDGDGLGNFTLLGGVNSALRIDGSLLSADADSIDFDFAGSDGFALFQSPAIGSGQNWWCVEGFSSTCAGFGVGETVNRLGTATYAQITSAQSIATTGNAVPEPGSLALLGLGLAGVAALRRRQAD